MISMHIDMGLNESLEGNNILIKQCTISCTLAKLPVLNKMKKTESYLQSI